MRLDRFLASAGAGTRSEVKKLLRSGQVTVNGAREVCADRKIDPAQDDVALSGRRIRWEPFVCLMFHKPSGCVTATKDRSAKTVMDYIGHERRAELFPVGRLDADTEGLLFLTNDGELAHRMLSPAHHVEKTYYARLDGPVTQEDAEAFCAGVDIGEKRPTLPARLAICGDGREAEITVTEGKYHQVKRMFAARGRRVLYLKRIAMAGIELDKELLPGQWRELTEEETERLRTLCWKEKE